MAYRLGPRLRFLPWAPGLAALLVAFLLLGTLLPSLLRQSVSDMQLIATLGLAALGGAIAMAGVLLWFRRSFLHPFPHLLQESENLAAGDTSADRVEEQIEEKEAERHRLQEILAGVPLGVLVTGPDGRLIYANPTLHTLFGVRYTDSEKVSGFLSAPEIQAALAQASEGDGVVEVCHTYNERDLAVSTRRIEALGILLMIRDVTESNRVERMRRDFVANLSHEIKTPLAVIRGAAETLEEADDDASVIEHFVPIMVRQIYRLEDLLEDLLTLSRLESPEAALETQIVHLGEVCERAVELIEAVAEREQVTIEATIGEVAPFDGDSKALERLVLNLLVNSVQYNRPGGSVRLRLEEGEDGIALEVEDDGYGIPPEDLPRIFERFYRVDKGRGRREGGSGLGLAIVKHVTQFHAGSVEVRSYLDRGSVFRVLLPGAKHQAA